VALALAGLSVGAADSSANTTRGKAEYERICSACHDLGAGTANKRSRSQWTAVVEDMKAMGAEGTNAEMQLVIDYLTANFGTGR